MRVNPLDGLSSGERLDLSSSHSLTLKPLAAPLSRSFAAPEFFQLRPTSFFFWHRYFWILFVAVGVQGSPVRLPACVCPNQHTATSIRVLRSNTACSLAVVTCSIIHTRNPLAWPPSASLLAPLSPLHVSPPSSSRVNHGCEATPGPSIWEELLFLSRQYTLKAYAPYFCFIHLNISYYASVS